MKLIRAILLLLALGLVGPAAAQDDESFFGKPAPGTYQIHVLDTGTGLATIIEGADFLVVYDDGSNDPGAADRLVPYLKTIRPDLSTIDHVVLSHPHTDHVLFLPSVVTSYHVADFWDSGRVYESCGYHILLAKIMVDPSIRYHDAIGDGGTHSAAFRGTNCKGKPPAKIKLHESTQIDGKPVRLGDGATMTFLYANAGGTGNPNANSLVVLFKLGTVHALFMGDAEAGGRKDDLSTAPKPTSIEGRLLACCANKLAADILIAGHHGSRSSSREPFLDAVGAKLFVISSGPKAYSGTVLPDRVVVNAFEARGTLLRTDAGDTACKARKDKVGGKDGKSAGCSNIVLSITQGGAIHTAVWPMGQ